MLLGHSHAHLFTFGDGCFCVVVTIELQSLNYLLSVTLQNKFNSVTKEGSLGIYMSMYVKFMFIFTFIFIFLYIFISVNRSVYSQIIFWLQSKYAKVT